MCRSPLALNGTFQTKQFVSRTSIVFECMALYGEQAPSSQPSPLQSKLKFVLPEFRDTQLNELSRQSFLLCGKSHLKIIRHSLLSAECTEVHLKQVSSFNTDITTSLHMTHSKVNIAENKLLQISACPNTSRVSSH